MRWLTEAGELTAHKRSYHIARKVCGLRGKRRKRVRLLCGEPLVGLRLENGQKAQSKKRTIFEVFHSSLHPLPFLPLSNKQHVLMTNQFKIHTGIYVYTYVYVYVGFYLYFYIFI